MFQDLEEAAFQPCGSRNPDRTLVGLGAECCQIFRLANVDKNAPIVTDRSAFAPAGTYGTPDSNFHLSTLDSIANGAGSAEVSKGDWQILAAPARYQGVLNGAAVLWRQIDRGVWTDDDRLLIGDVANQIGITVEQLIHRFLKLCKEEGIVKEKL